MTATSPALDPRALVPELLARDAWSRETLLDHQRDRLRALLDHAVARSPYYREAFGAQRSLEALPVLSKATLMTEWDRIACDPALSLEGVEAHVEAGVAGPYLGRFRVGTTSGATGLRGLFVYGPQDFTVWTAACARQIVRCGGRPGDRMISIAARDAVHISKQIYAVLVGESDDKPELHALTPLPEMVAALNEFAPDHLMGYSGVLGLLAGEQLSGRLRIAPRMVAGSSEPLTADIRARLRAAWGAEPINIYATTEALLVAGTTPAAPDVLEIPEDMIVLEVVDADNRPVAPGETGEKILLTNLANFTLPLIRYELTDRVTLGAGPNPTGRPYAWLSAIEGRTNDTLRMPARAGGSVEVLPYRLGEPFARLPEVRQFQLDWDGAHLLARVVLRDAEDAARVEPELTRALDAAGAAPIPITVLPVAELEREPGPAAKLKLIRNLQGQTP
jgi:phenylacetate-coenzyme A ligase PaaK-like adenylate-forming protein